MPCAAMRVLAGLGGKIKQHVAAGLVGLDLGELVSDALEQRGVAEISRHIVQSLGERVPEVFIEAWCLRRTA